MSRRILCITSNFPRWRGDSTTPFVLNLGRDLAELGWDVDVLAPHAPGTALYEVMEEITVHRYRYLWPDTLETVCYQGGALINLRRDKTNYLKLPFLVGAQWLGIMKLLKSRNYDILHSHWILPQGFNGVLAAKLLTLSHVVTVHGGDVFGLQSRPLTMIKRKVLRNADAVTVNSSVTEKAVRQIAPELKSIHRIPMGVSLAVPSQMDRTREIRSKYRNGNGPLLVYAGRLVDEKGVEDLIRAVAILSHEFPDVTAMIIGDGQDRKVMEALSDSLNLGQRVYFLGWIETELVSVHLAAADIFVGPSRQATDGWIEAQGLTFIEAMVAKTPVIATRAGGITDSVIHEETGLLVNERSPEEIADAIIRLMGDSHLRNKLAANGYALASSRFSRQHSAEAFDVLFKTLRQDNRHRHG
jgi:phosphatidyl-myo-inositol dimannoside synthase